MTEVGVREFKSDVSGYLKRAAGGERIRVTSRGTPLVELVPLDPPADAAADQMERLRRSGVVSSPRDAKHPVSRQRFASTLPGSVSDDIVAERERERRA